MVIHGLLAIATVFDPRFKLKLTEYYFPKIYGNDSEKHIVKVRKMYYDLVSEYQVKYSDGQDTMPMDLQVSSMEDVHEHDTMDPLAAYDLFVSSTSNVDGVKSELDYYLEESILLRAASFDILAWSLIVVIDLLRHLTSCHPIAEVLICDGFVVRLVNVLNYGVLGVRIVVAEVVHQMVVSSKSRKEMGECGCIEPLSKMLDGKAAKKKESATKTLSTLMFYASYRKIFRRDERGIVSAVQLLDPSIKNLDRKYPVAVLAALTHSSKCRKQMVDAGACVQ
ncbi:hypothetical protein Ddye_008071 [Dipteronia dyeriana]|uniref:hAT-like transposase RNase-H fold domain-containing protein n=1 Tax=Dipteronia dyeriana TaxID=168575 RepID=A0AAD9X901_9ROSI|nr:hypothetical protein Ddye_008071 [Dipteronia dyeriana]